MRRALGAHHHPAQIRGVQRDELGEHGLVFRGAEIRQSCTTAGRNKEVGIEGDRALARGPVYETRQLATVSLRYRRLNDEVHSMRAQPRNRRGGGLERPMPAAKVVVLLRRQRIDRDREAGDAALLSNTIRLSSRSVPFVPTTTVAPLCAACSAIRSRSVRRSGSPPERM